jgi:hypothetical protein
MAEKDGFFSVAGDEVCTNKPNERESRAVIPGLRGEFLWSEP